METSALIRKKKLHTRNDKSYKIQSYGESNDLPQVIAEIINSSATGSAGIRTYYKFISGKGLVSNILGATIVNKRGHSLNTVLDRCAKDYAEFGGFAMHVIYDLNLDISEIYHCPFESVRLGALNDSGVMNFYALHWDWGRRYPNLRAWKKEDIEYINKFDPNKVREQIIQLEKDGKSFDDYKGQLYYFSNAGSEYSYPLPIYNAALTDMSSEEGLSNITYKNSRNNFLSAGLLVDINSNPQNKDSMSDVEQSLMDFQGDEEACSIMYASVSSKEDIPTFVPFKSNNYDKDYTVSNELVKDKIGRSLIQPPILRAESISSNFGADLMKNAYNFYNSITDKERAHLADALKKILSNWYAEINIENTEIEPLSYDIEESLAEKLGDTNLTKVMDIIDSEKTPTQKYNLLKTLFNLSDSQIKDLIV